MITIEVIVKKKIFGRGDFSIWSCIPLDEYLSICPVDETYGNISISGMLPELVLNEKYKFDLEFDDTSKYSNSYKVVRIYEDQNLTSSKADRFLQGLVTELQ